MASDDKFTPRDQGFQFGENCTHSRTHYFDIDGKIIPYFISTSYKGGNIDRQRVVVPGIKVSDEYAPSCGGLEVIDIKHISDPELRKRLEDSLGSKGKDGIVFWGETEEN
ncbi:hypothetical protein GOV12_04955 [Candidatus Pacearchaeota archaeon]|nr:hypothetical protein [Candidatus Pacearchaeota archaeon]